MKRGLRGIRLIGSLVWVLIISTAAMGAATKIQFWWGESDLTEHMQAMVNRFNETQSAVFVELTDQGYMGSGAGLNKVKVAIAGGVPPDVVWMDAVHILAHTLGESLYIPLNDVIDQKYLDAIPFLPGPARYVTHQGRFLGLQCRTDARGLYYNLDLFDDAGLDARITPRSIEELDAFANRLTKWRGDGSVSQLGFSTRSDNLCTVGWFWVFGGSVFDYDSMKLTLTNNPRHVQALEWILSYADLYGPTASSGSASFIEKKVAMFVQSTTWLKLFPQRAPDLRWGVGVIPHPPEGRATTFSSGMGVVIPRGAAHPKAAGEFIKFLAQKETQIEWYKRTQALPARSDALMELIRERVIVDPRERVMVERLPQTGIYPPLDDFVTPELHRNVDRMRRREITPEQVLEDTQRVIEPQYRTLFGN